MLFTGLNEAQDISVKVISCRELLQENIVRHDLTPAASKTLGEVMTCAIMYYSFTVLEVDSLLINLLPIV